ncbi:tetraspanin-10 [Trichechus inunguis]
MVKKDLQEDAVGLELPPSTSSLPTSSCPHPSPREDHSGAWGCICCPPGAKRRSWRGGLRRSPATSLPAGSTCIKYLTFLSNFLFSLLGLLSLAAGLWGLAVKGPVGSSWGCALPTDAMLGLVLGGLAISAVSLAGCLGALCESPCLLRCFSAGLLVFLALEATAGILVVALWGPLWDSLDHALHVAISHYQDNPDLCFLLDQVQLRLQCCGAISYRDWQLNPYFNGSSPGVQACSLPASCCIDPGEEGASVHTQCGSGALRPGEAAARRVVHLEGCGPRLRGWLHQSAHVLGGGAIAVALVQGVELLLAARLLSALAVRQGAAEGVRLKPGQLPTLLDGASQSPEARQGALVPDRSAAACPGLSPLSATSDGCLCCGPPALRLLETFALRPPTRPPVRLPVPLQADCMLTPNLRKPPTLLFATPSYSGLLTRSPVTANVLPCCPRLATVPGPRQPHLRCDLLWPPMCPLFLLKLVVVGWLARPLHLVHTGASCGRTLPMVLLRLYSTHDTP